MLIAILSIFSIALVSFAHNSPTDFNDCLLKHGGQYEKTKLIKCFDHLPAISKKEIPRFHDTIGPTKKWRCFRVTNEESEKLIDTAPEASFSPYPRVGDIDSKESFIDLIDMNYMFYAFGSIKVEKSKDESIFTPILANSPELNIVFYGRSIYDGIYGIFANAKLFSSAKVGHQVENGIENGTFYSRYIDQSPWRGRRGGKDSTHFFFAEAFFRKHPNESGAIYIKQSSGMVKRKGSYSLAKARKKTDTRIYLCNRIR